LAVAYQRRTLAADALIASTYVAGTNTRRVRRALAALLGGTVGKDTVSRTWRKVKSDWDAWNTRSLAGEPIVRLIMDGTVVRETRPPGPPPLRYRCLRGGGRGSFRSRRVTFQLCTVQDISTWLQQFWAC
jgi:hypothetical protein